MLLTCPSNNRFLRWGLTEVDEEPPVALTLVVRHGHDAADIVLLLTVLLFGEVANQMTPFLVILKEKETQLIIFGRVDSFICQMASSRAKCSYPGEDVKQERLDVVVERFVVQKQLDEKA